MRQGRRIRVYGQVQGVAYRLHAKAKAEEFGLTGFARNDNDGSVYIEAYGEPEELSKLVEWCKNGSPAAQVKQVELEQFEPGFYEYEGFTIT